MKYAEITITPGESGYRVLAAYSEATAKEEIFYFSTGQDLVEWLRPKVSIPTPAGLESLIPSLTNPSRTYRDAPGYDVFQRDPAKTTVG